MIQTRVRNNNLVPYASCTDFLEITLKSFEACNASARKYSRAFSLFPVFQTFFKFNLHCVKLFFYFGCCSGLFSLSVLETHVKDRDTD